MLKRGRAALAALALALVAVAVAIAVPALADHAPVVVTVSYTGPVTEGQEIALSCPGGYQVRAESGRVVASATYYRDPNLRSVLAADVPPDAVGQFGVTWIVPRGVRSASATMECVLIDQTQHPTTTSTPPSTTAPAPTSTATTVPTTSTTTTVGPTTTSPAPTTTT